MTLQNIQIIFRYLNTNLNMLLRCSLQSRTTTPRNIILQIGVPINFKNMHIRSVKVYITKTIALFIYALLEFTYVKEKGSV